MPNQTEEKIKDMLSRSLGANKKDLVPGASFEVDFNIAQEDLKSAVTGIFKEFKMEDDPNAERRFKTVGELIEFVKDYLDEIEE